MEPKITITKPNGERVYPPNKLQWVEFVTRWLDSKFVIPGTRIRFGLDPMLSLFPVLGDVLTYLVSISLIYTMHRHGASREVVIRMIINSSLDAVIGAIPGVGTIFDVFYRSNERNLRLLKEHYTEGKYQGRGTGLIVTIIIMAVVTVLLVLYAVWKLAEALFAQ